MISAVACLIVLSVLSTEIAGSAYTCPLGFSLYRETCYAYMEGKRTWQDAETTCAAIHAHLAEIYNQGEMDFIKNLTRAHGGQHGDVWLGGHDLVVEGTWSWAWSGADLTYTHWSHGQPNNGDHNEDCMELRAAVSWNDQDCHELNQYICQISASPDADIIG